MKITARAKVISFIGILVFSSLLHAALLDDLTPEQAFQQGTLLFQQNKYTLAKPLLVYAANNDHSGAALMCADMEYGTLFSQSVEEYKYLEKAARLGNISAMAEASSRRALGDNEYWKKKVVPLLEQRADVNDGLAMRLLYGLSHDEDNSFRWLRKAAEAGDAFSQHELARRYEMGHSWFIIPGKREKEIERLFKAAADSGYWLGMRTYALLLKKQGDIDGYQSIIGTLFEAGDALTILGLGVYDIEFKKYESAAYYSKIYLDSMGSEGKKSGYNAAQHVYDEAIMFLTPEQIDQVDIKAQEYLKTHTVHYQKRIKDYEYTLDSIKQAKP